MLIDTIFIYPNCVDELHDDSVIYRTSKCEEDDLVPFEKRLKKEFDTNGKARNVVAWPNLTYSTASCVEVVLNQYPDHVFVVYRGDGQWQFILKRPTSEKKTEVARDST